MGMNCEEIRQLLVEIEYGEREPGRPESEQLDAHLEACSECRDRKVAYREVRADLRAWNDATPQPSRVAFVAMAPQATRRRWSRWQRGAAVAASFIFGIMLTATALNLDVRDDTGGWNLSTSLWPRADNPRESLDPVDAGGLSPQTSQTSQTIAAETSQSSEPAAADPGAPGSSELVPSMVSASGARLVARDEISPFATMTQDQLDDYLQGWARDHGLDSPRPVQISDNDQAVAEQIQTLFDQRDNDFHTGLIQLIADSEMRQQQMYAARIADMYSNFEMQRANDLYLLSSQLGFFQEDTGQQLQLASAYIDYLLSQVSSQPQERQRQEPPR